MAKANTACLKDSLYTEDRPNSMAEVFDMCQLLKSDQIKINSGSATTKGSTKKINFRSISQNNTSKLRAQEIQRQY